jgi:hypothetical protein
MRRIHVIVGLAFLTAGFLASVALTFPGAASAWDWRHIPNGYSTTVAHYVNLDGDSCSKYWIDGQYMGDDCVDPGGLQANIDAYINSTICTRNLAAGISAGVCQAATTTTTAATTGTVATTTTDPGTTTTPDPGSTTNVGGSSAASDPSQTVTTTVTVTVADPDTQAQLTELQQRVATDEARIQELEDQIGTILGEQKNEPPFTS